MHFLRSSFQAGIWSTYCECSWKKENGASVFARASSSQQPCMSFADWPSMQVPDAKQINMPKKNLKAWKKTKEQTICPDTWRSTVPSDLLCIPGSNSWAAFRDRDRVARPKIPAITQWKWKQQHRCQWYDASFIVPGRMGVQYGFGVFAWNLKSVVVPRKWNI